jgi:hypothetical protein
MRTSESVPAPIEADYYNHSEDQSTRGAAVQQVSRQRMDILGPLYHESSKVQNIFGDHCKLPQIPSDPLYTFPRSTFVVRHQGGSEVGNRILSILEASCPSSAGIIKDGARMKVTVKIEGCLDMKIKLFEHRDGVLVVCRRDSGDWFAFSKLFMQLANSF